MMPTDAPTSVALRLLIVEDEALLAMDLKDMAEELGHEVVAMASDIEMAVNAIEGSTTPPQAAILDANLNGQPAAPIAQLLRRKRIPFVLSTGHDVGALRDAGYDEPVLAKPFDLNQLGDALGELAAAASRRV